MLKLFKYLKPYIFQILLLIAVTYGQVMVSLQLPSYMSEIVNKGILLQDLDFIWDTGLKMIGVTAIGGVCAVIAGYISSRVGSGFSKSLRKDVFEKIESFSLQEFKQFSTASLITRSTNDVQQIQMVLIVLLRVVLSAPIMGIGAILKAYHTAPSMTWIMGIAVTVLLLFIFVIFFVGMPKFQLLQKLVDKINLLTRQNLTGIRVIRAFNTQDVESKKFDSVNNELSSTYLFINRLMGLMQPIMMLVFNFTTLAIMWVGSHLISDNMLYIGDIMAFMQYAVQVIMAFLMISAIFIIIPRASVSGKRISEVLNTKLSILNPVKPLHISEDMKGVVEFKDVTFKYPDADVPVLYNISFVAKPGTTTAIIGGTGSGKSTVVNLIPRFFDVTSGQVLVGGVDVRDLKLKELRRMIGYVPQKGVLFSGSVKSNIAYGGENISDEDMKRAAQISQSLEFISNLDGQFDYSIAQGGVNVSGGQRQRLSIARALAIKPDIYIFDDSFSALDFKTSSKLLTELKREVKNSTLIIIGQRIGTVLDADQIVVLDNGRVAGIGRHKELMKTCEVYREIALSQLSEEELKR